MSEVIAPEHVLLQYDVETAYGTTPTNPTMNWIGIVQDVTPGLDMSKLKAGGIGSADIAYIRNGLRKPEMTIKYIPQNITFMDYARSIPIGLTLEYLAEYGATPSYVSLVHKGMLIDSMEVVLPKEDWDVVTLRLIGQNVTYGTAAITGETAASDPATAPYSWFDAEIEMDVNGGLSEILVFGTSKFYIRNHLRPIPVIRATNPTLLKYLQRSQRELGGEIQAYFEDKTHLDEVLASTDFAIRFTLTGSTPFYDFTGCYWDRHTLTTRIKEIPCYVNLAFTATGVDIT